MGTSLIDPGAFTYSSGVLTCVTPGEYEVILSVKFASSTSGIRAFALKREGSAPDDRRQQFLGATSLDLSFNLIWNTALAAGDTITPQVQQNSGGNLAVSGEISLERVL